MSRAALAVFDEKALEHNLRRVRAAAPSSRVMAVVKANGYGHGLLRVTRGLSSADGFAVASIEEALMLREAGIAHPVSLLTGFSETSELSSCAKHHLVCALHSEYQLDMLERARLPVPLAVWVKIDTGMNRLGFLPSDVQTVLRRLGECAAVRKPIGIMTHLAHADDLASDMTVKQLERFENALAGVSGPRSIANSGGILGWSATHAQWVRPGIMLYGASPFTTASAADYDLRPVMTLQSKLIAIKHIQRGDTVGYGGDWVCPEAMSIGIAAIGYGDGYPRHARVGTPVLINGQRAALVGRVSMDMICIDLRSHPDARVGDTVTLWGRGLPVEEIAEWSGTIAYQLLCNVTARVKVVAAAARR